MGLHPEGLYRGVELRAQFEQLLALVAGNADTLQVFVPQYVNPFTVIADLTDRPRLLRGNVGDAYGGSGDGGNRPDNFIQCPICVLGLLGSSLRLILRP